jgi:hypothetical protein
VPIKYPIFFDTMKLNPLLALARTVHDGAANYTMGNPNDAANY